MFDQMVWRRQITDLLGDFARDPRQEVQLAGVQGVLPYLVLRTLAPFLEAFHTSPVDAVVTLAHITRGAGADMLVQRVMRRRVLTAADVERDLLANAALRTTVEHLLVELQTIPVALQNLNARRGEWLKVTLEREFDGYAGSFHRMRAILRDVDGRLRIEGLRYLRASNGRYTHGDLELINDALADNSAHVRASASRLLGVMVDPPPPPLVIRLLHVALRDSDAETRFAAARALGMLRDRIVTADLLKQIEIHLFHDDRFYRAAAALVLGQLGERVGEPAIVRSLSCLLQDPDPYAREAAARALGRIGCPAALPEVLEALSIAVQDGDIQVHEAATDALLLLRQQMDIPVRVAA